MGLPRDWCKRPSALPAPQVTNWGASQSLSPSTEGHTHGPWCGAWAFKGSQSRGNTGPVGASSLYTPTVGPFSSALMGG